MYEARFTTKQIYDNYAKSVSKPKSYTYKPAKSRSLGGFEPDPAQRNTTTKKITYTPPTNKKKKKNKGSTYDEVPQVLTQGIVQRPKPKPTKETGYEKVTRIFNEAMSGFGDFEVPTQPTFDTVKPQNLYKDNRYFGPQVYTPDTSQFGRGYEKKYFLGMELPTGSPSLPRSLKKSNVNIFGNTKDHPRLNMFGVKRSYTRNPDSLMAPPTMSKPEINFDDRTELRLGTRNAIARALDFVEESDPQTTIITSQHTVQKGESLLSIIEDFNRDKPDKEKVTLEEVGELNKIPNAVADPFGKIEKGDVLQIPVKKETAVQVLRQEIERERKVKKELLEFKRLSGEDKIKVLKEKGIIPKESIQKISDIGELSPEVEAELEDILLALEKETGSKEDLTDLSQAGSNTTEELKNLGTEVQESAPVYTDDDMGIPIGPVPDYNFMLPGSAFTEALKDKEADNYDTIFGNAEIRNTPFKNKKVSDMTMEEVYEFTKAGGEFNKYNKKRYNKNTTAIGKYQTVGSTLRDLKKRGVLSELGISDNTKFDRKTQDDIAAYLAVHRIKDRATKGDGNIATRGQARKEMRNEWEGFNKLSDKELDVIIDDIAREVGVNIVETKPLTSKRPKIRPSGIMSSPRPKLRPER
tara:strand:- start:215 stop:2128 length:1914 start_codon:yes stop_codon:yes gene_type:complete